MMTTITLAVLALAAVCFAARLALGPSLPDRVIAMDGLIIVGISAIAVRAMQSGDGSFLPVLVVLTLVGFVSTAASARFIEARGVELLQGDQALADDDAGGTPAPTDTSPRPPEHGSESSR